MKNKKVLIVEDDPFQQIKLSAMLKFLSIQYSTGVEIHSASSLTAAYEALYDTEGSEAFDLIVADICLGPDEYSFKLRELCQKNYPSTEFVFTSGQLSEEAFRDSYFRKKNIPFISKTGRSNSYFRELENHLFKS